MSTKRFQGNLKETSFRYDVWIFFSFLVLLCLVNTESFAVTTQSLKDPIKNFKTEAFDWALVVKIISVVAGSAASAVTSSLKPLGGGVAVAAALSFFESYINVSSALIG